MIGVNRVTLLGNTGKDPEIQILEGNAKVAKFTLATAENYKDSNGQTKTHTEWHNVVCWRGLADVCENYVKKGSLLLVEGKIRNRSYEDKTTGQKKYVSEIIAENVILLDKKETKP